MQEKLGETEATETQVASAETKKDDESDRKNELSNDSTPDVPSKPQLEDPVAEPVEETTDVPEDPVSKRNDSDDGGLESLEDFEAAGLALATSTVNEGIPPIPESKAVDPKRKEELLRKARTDRLRWISKARLPYHKQVDSDDPWQKDDRLSTFRSAATDIPAAVPLLGHLYGESSTAASRIDSILKAGWKEEVSEEPIAEMNDSDDPTIQSYEQFIAHLQEPACAMLVQGMRRFCQTMKNVHDKDSLATQMKAYLSSAISSVKTHAVFKDQEEVSLRRSLESFIYAQCDSHLKSIMWNIDAQEKDKAWVERLSNLQFVNPTHLEIACLEENDLEDILKDPIQALLAVSSYFSPYEKLECILSVYRGVNEALAKALNRHRASDGEAQKMPSADDVLPAIILVILKAKPSRLHLDLEIVEEWSPPEYVRGEAGYAYTNLYGAVQFLQELDMKEPNSLSISAEDFRKGLAACKSKADDRLLTDEMDTRKFDTLESVAPEVHISPQAVRDARMRGETVNIEWAHRLWKETCKSKDSLPSQMATEQRSAFDEAFDGLPPAFSRNYTFLTARPEDIKLSDLPQLLSEYQTLVQTTEKLIGDRAAKIIGDRKARAAGAQKDLFDRVREIDPTLLPPKTESKSRKNSM